MVDIYGHGLDRSPVGRMIITENRSTRPAFQDDLQRLPHVLFDGLGIRTPILQLQFPAPTFLMPGHPPFPA